MPTKLSENSENAVELFLKIGLDERVAHNTIANSKVTSNLLAVIHEVFFHFLSICDSNNWVIFVLFIDFLIVHLCGKSGWCY